MNDEKGASYYERKETEKIFFIHQKLVALLGADRSISDLEYVSAVTGNFQL